MPFRYESSSIDPPSDDEVLAVVTHLRSWRYVEPHHRAQLRAAVAGLPLVPATARPQPNPERHYTVAQLVDMLGASASTVRALIKSGALAGYRLSSKPGSEYRVTDTALREFLDVERFLSW